MSRPPKCRRVAFLPGVTYFKPAGIPLRALEEVRLSVEEAEAIRLKDLEGLEQEQGAEKMNVSRPTFQRVLASARLKMADALLNGKAIRIEGGNFEMSPLRFSCAYGHEWEVPFDTATGMLPQFCPTCKTPEIVPLQTPGTGWGRGGYGYGARRRRGWQKGRISTIK
jgi:predicted DNA-binding protein (UPF0251 family)